MNNSKGLCRFFLQGNCKFGDSCKFLHLGNPQNQNQFHKKPNQNADPIKFNNPPPDASFKNNQKQAKITHPDLCKYFLSNSCSYPDCGFFHGYGTTLQNASTEKAHDNPINNLVSITSEKFITSSETEIVVRLIQQQISILTTIPSPEGKISKLIYSNGKIIFSTVIETMLASKKTKLFVLNDNGNVSCESTLPSINDIIEVENYIICCGLGKWEVFQFSQTGLVKTTEIANDDEVMSITLLKNIFICGQKNGALSIYEPGQGVFLTQTKSWKVHEGQINKIAIKSMSEVSNFIITCSNDNFIKVFNYENNMCIICERNCFKEIYDIYNTVDADGKDCFLVSVGNEFFVINDALEFVFDIPSRNGSGVNRKCLAMKNPFDQPQIGNLVVWTDGNLLDINAWIKEGSFVSSKKNNCHNNHNNNNNNNNHNQNQFNQNNRGNYRGGRGNQGGNRGGRGRGFGY